MAVVKADAYGHGAVPVARAALEAGAYSLAVATAEEGAELRRAGITVPILVLTDLLPDGLALAEEHQLEVTAHSVPSAKRIAGRPDLTAHLKIDTGMNRWGVEPDEVGEASPPPTPMRRRPTASSPSSIRCSPRKTSAG
jgi:alanine racemase